METIGRLGLGVLRLRAKRAEGFLGRQGSEVRHGVSKSCHCYSLEGLLQPPYHREFHLQKALEMKMIVGSADKP